MLAPAMSGISVAEYAPNQVKKTVVGAGHADKNQIRVMLGVLLNLLLGLSRVLLAMGRRGDMPARTAALNHSQTTPSVAVLGVGVAVGGLALTGDVRTRWSSSAFTVPIHYAIPHLAALRLPRERRLYPPVLAWGGLAACLFLAFWVDWPVWLSGLALIAAGLVWHAVFARGRPS